MTSWYQQVAGWGPGFSSFTGVQERDPKVELRSLSSRGGDSHLRAVVPSLFLE